MSQKIKKLIVFDMDSTLIHEEVIDELGKFLGIEKKIAKITEEAMEGKIPFDESLRRRVSLLKGLDIKVFPEIYAQLTVKKGVPELVAYLKEQKWITGILSGGFNVFADPLRAKLSMNFSYSNELEVKGTQLTGRLKDDEVSVNAEKKALLLERISIQNRVDLAHTVAVGDGANDIPMLQKAGLGIALNAKEIVKKHVKVSLDLENLFDLISVLEKKVKNF